MCRHPGSVFLEVALLSRWGGGAAKRTQPPTGSRTGWSLKHCPCPPSLQKPFGFSVSSGGGRKWVSCGPWAVALLLVCLSVLVPRVWGTGGVAPRLGTVLPRGGMRRCSHPATGQLRGRPFPRGTLPGQLQAVDTDQLPASPQRIHCTFHRAPGRRHLRSAGLLKAAPASAACWARWTTPGPAQRRSSMAACPRVCPAPGTHRPQYVPDALLCPDGPAGANWVQFRSAALSLTPGAHSVLWRWRPERGLGGHNSAQAQLQALNGRGRTWGVEQVEQVHPDQPGLTGAQVSRPVCRWPPEGGTGAADPLVKPGAAGALPAPSRPSQRTAGPRHAAKELG